jgi:hypothetical protein
MSRASATAWQAEGTTIGYTNNGKVPHVIDTESNRTTYIYDGHDPIDAAGNRALRQAQEAIEHIAGDDRAPRSFRAQLPAGRSSRCVYKVKWWRTGART